ncbi:MAG: 4-hydroxy-3-methylbut-2-enyl diphosphate reductase, partial [Candidatus Cloacimonetes bacterium]|nr:4-hydroxy-3-methylbut-2-enyl diphosphate reductase [Candidatus Cloacimonadota bacterium]
MKIRLAKNSGFCYGVKRAIQIAKETVASGGRIHTLGPIIHNPQMVSELERKGISSVNSIEEVVEGDYVIIRSHGVPESTLEALTEKKAIVVNATCPYVAKTQEHARKLNQDGYSVFILGNREHPEVIGLKSYAGDNVKVINDATEFPSGTFKRIGIIAQTTQIQEKLSDLVAVAVQHSPEMVVYNTICHATAIRQQSTRELATQSDLMIIIGGRNSSNTCMLSKISEKYAET